MMEDLPFDIGCARFVGLEDVQTELISCKKGDCLHNACYTQLHLTVRITVRARTQNCSGSCCVQRHYDCCVTVEVPRGYCTSTDLWDRNRMHCRAESFRCNSAFGTATLTLILELYPAQNTCITEQSATCQEPCTYPASRCGGVTLPYSMGGTVCQNTCGSTWQNNGFWYQRSSCGCNKRR